MKAPRRIRDLLSIDLGTGLKAPVVVLGLALSAGIHLAVAYQHSTAGDHGRFFVTIGAAQAILAVAVARRPSRWALWAAIGLSAFVAGTWLVARLALLPVITGPPGPTGLLDTSATALEVMVLTVALLELRRRGPAWRFKPNVVAVLAVVAFPGLALAALPQAHGAHSHHHGEEPIQQGGAAPNLSVFGDLFDAHHAGHKGDAAHKDEGARNAAGGG